MQSAAKVLREIGGESAPDLAALVGQLHGFGAEVHRLSDGRVLVQLSFARTGHIYASADAFRAFMARLETIGAGPCGHPLGDSYPAGAGFIDAVPGLITRLPERLGIPAARLDGSVDGLAQLDRAARRVGGRACLDDPALLAGLVAYVGEVARNAGGGSWAIDAARDDWEPVIRTGGPTFRPFVIFKELLERGSMYAAVSGHLDWSPGAAPRRQGAFADRTPAVAPAIGALGALPAEAYAVATRYGDGRPWKVHLAVDVEIDGVPLVRDSDAHVTRGGALISGVLSRPHAVLDIPFPAGTTVSLRTGRLRGVGSAKLGADHEIQGVPCRAGGLVQFRFHHGRPYLAAATLAAPHTFGGVSYPAGTWFGLDRDGTLTSERVPGWDQPRR